jgi:hypothetical protein
MLILVPSVLLKKEAQFHLAHVFLDIMKNTTNVMLVTSNVVLVLVNMIIVLIVLTTDLDFQTVLLVHLVNMMTQSMLIVKNVIHITINVPNVTPMNVQDV